MKFSRIFSKKKHFTISKRLFLLFFSFIILGFNLHAQQLEPRALTNVPVGMNFILFGYGYSQGNILLDPAFPVDNLNAKLHLAFGAYLRSLKIFGLAGKVDVVVPWASGDWTGVFTGIDTARSVSGIGDIKLRISVNFLGAPPLKMSEYRDYKPTKISGISLQIFAPTGQYDPDRLINLGSNRWVFKPQWGFSRYLKSWIFETYVSTYFFTVNNEFFGGSVLKQNPLGVIKLHAIKSFPKRWWISMGAGYGLGGRTYIDGDEKDTRISTFIFGLIIAAPIKQNHTIRLIFSSGVRLERGSDFNGVALSYQYRWIRKK